MLFCTFIAVIPFLMIFCLSYCCYCFIILYCSSFTAALSACLYVYVWHVIFYAASWGGIRTQGSLDTNPVCSVTVIFCTALHNLTIWWLTTSFLKLLYSFLSLFCFESHCSAKLCAWQSFKSSIWTDWWQNTAPHHYIGHLCVFQ